MKERYDDNGTEFGVKRNLADIVYCGAGIVKFITSWARVNDSFFVR